MSKPHPGSLEALKLWLNGESEGAGGRTIPSFQGLMAKRLDNADDLVALHPPFERDWLSRLVEYPFLRLLCLVRLIILRLWLCLAYFTGLSRRWIYHDHLEAKNESGYSISEHPLCCFITGCIHCSFISRSKSKRTIRTFMWILSNICSKCSSPYKCQKSWIICCNGSVGIWILLLQCWS